MTDFAALRRQMIERDLVPRGVTDVRVLDAMATVPRQAFVPPGAAPSAYADCALPIDAGQTISQPLIVALMCQAAVLRATDIVLDVGTGSGYAAAVLSRLVAKVFTIERHAGLARQAADRLARLGCGNVCARHGDGVSGWPEHVPFDAILVAAAAVAIPPPLHAQLAVGGRLIMPVGEPAEQRLVKSVRRADGCDQQDLGAVAFVPLLGGTVAAH